jgi:hypothetical protein
VLELDEDARPAVLQSSHPRGDSRFCLQTRRGGLVKIYDSVLMSGVSSKCRAPQDTVVARFIIIVNVTVVWGSVECFRCSPLLPTPPPTHTQHAGP